MPTLNAMSLPKPLHWQEFETMTRDAMALKWASPSLQKNGRPGQKQKGVDIFGPDFIGRRVAIQCKRSVEAPTLKLIEDEANKAQSFGSLSALWIATTADHDAPLQEQVRTLSDKRVANGDFALGLLFWEDIVDGLKMNPAVLAVHYPQITIAPATTLDTERALAALELGYYGAELWEYIILVYGEFGVMAQTDPDELIAALRMLDHRSRQLLPPEDAEPIGASLDIVRKTCMGKIKKKSDWDPAEIHAKRISTRLSRAQAVLPLAEQNILGLAMQLGRLYHRLDDTPDDELTASVERKVRSVLPVESRERITEKFARASELKDGYRWAQRIYHLLDQELRWS